MIPLLAGLLATLAQNGLGMLASAIQAKGKEVIEEKIGVKIPDDPAKLSPELLQQLQIKQMDHEEFLVTAGLEKQKLELEEYKVDKADTANARDRDKEFIKLGKRNERGDVLAYLAVGSLCSCLLALFFVKDIPATNEKLLYLVVGALIVIVKDVYGFEFGSSKDSQRNAQAIVDQLNG
jgi:hypothetical protein